MGKKGPQKRGLGDRQVGAFSVFWPRHTAGPFIFWRKTRFFQKSEQLRGWCNTTLDLLTWEPAYCMLILRVWIVWYCLRILQMFAWCLVGIGI